jgi:hypothetical protein
VQLQTAWADLIATTRCDDAMGESRRPASEFCAFRAIYNPVAANFDLLKLQCTRFQT